MSGKPRRKYHRAPPEEREERVQMVCGLLTRGVQKSLIKSAFRGKYGDISPRHMEVYISEARSRLREQVGVPVEELRGAAYALYCSVLQNEKATINQKLLAQERIDKLLGLELQVGNLILQQNNSVTLQQVMDELDRLEETNERSAVIESSEETAEPARLL